MSRTDIRSHLPLAPRPEPHFQWRGREVSRLEGFSDAVFAFAMTLLIVALEVPHTYEGFIGILRGFPAFVASFALLLVFWNSHYRYFRRYGLEDGFTRFVTYAILMLVLFSVYPLKFLFSAWLGGHHSTEHPIQTLAQLQTIYRVFGLGLGAIWALFAALYSHALRRQGQLQLTPVELLLTREAFFDSALCVSASFLSVGLAELTSSEALPALAYALIPLGLLATGVRRRRKVRALLAPAVH
jgi:uncharacterized membrane protein